MKKLLFICVIVAFAAASWAKPLPTPDELFKGAAETAKTTRDMPHTWKAEQKADYDFFPISFWQAPFEISDKKFAEIAECGFNVAFVYTTLDQDKVLDLCEKYGMKAQLWLPDMLKYGGEDPELESHLGAIVDKYKDHPALWGYHLCDEPNPSDFAKIAEVRQFIKQRDPKHLSFVNLFPTYLSSFGTAAFGYGDPDRYVSEFCKMVKPEILSYDSYPFMKNGTDRTTYFSNLEIYRKYALKHDVPMNSIILSIPHTYAFEDKWGYRDPTEAEMRWEVYTSLAYGAKGILYFTYDVPKDNKSFDWGDALLNYDGSRNEKWYYAQQLNKEIKALGPTLLNLTSCAVYHTGEVPNMAKALPADNFLQVTGGDFVIGQFYDKAGDMYAMVTNRDYKNKVRAKMTFAKPVTVKEVAPHGGRALRTSPTEFVKDLKPGDGCLIKIDAFGPVVGWSNYVKPRPRVVLDPSDQFANGFRDEKGEFVKDENGNPLYIEGVNMYEIAEKVYNILRKDGKVDAFLNRDYVTEDIPLKREALMGRRLNADVFVAFHSDAPYNPEWDLGGGTWSFYRDLGGDEGLRLAECLEENILGAIRTVYPEAKYRGVCRHSIHLHVLYNTYCPASLVETLFHTIPHEVEILKYHQDVIAQGYVKGIYEYLGIE